MRQSLLFLGPALFLAACGASPITLHAPTLTPNAGAPTPIDFQTLVPPADPDTAILIPSRIQQPGPLPVLEKGIRAELTARAFRGGEAGGYGVRCRLDRFAFRSEADKTFGYAVAYADLGCDVKRKADSAPIWRGELRGRSAALGALQFFTDAAVRDQVLADRVMSDLTRELASDLAVRVLGLQGEPSARVFANPDAEQQLAGLNDTPAGEAALTQDPEKAVTFAETAHRHDVDRMARAAAWNAIAMASGPDRAWIGGIETKPASDTFVRFFQYKALARHATPATLRELKTARAHEGNDLLLEFLNDLEPTGGLPLSSARASSTPASQ